MSIKSILFSNRIDIFFIILIFILILSPVFINYISKKESKLKIVNLYLSIRCEELLGKGLTELLLKEFNEQNPDIVIKLEYTGNETVQQVMTEQQAADILIFNEGDFSALVAEGSLAELINFYKFDDEESKDLESENIHYAIPLVSFMDLLFYNIEILSDTGFDHPPKTRDEFLAYSRAVARSKTNASMPDSTAISLNLNDRQALSRDIFSWIWANGGDFWANDEEKPVINTRNIINDITFLCTLNRDGLLAPGIFETSGDQRIDEFAGGKIAMMIASSRAIPYLREKMGDAAFGITTIPNSSTSGKYNINISSIYAGINSSGVHSDEAWRFLKFISEKSLLFCEQLHAVPGSVTNIISSDYIKDDIFYLKAWDIFEASRIVQGFSGKHGAQKYKTAFLEEFRKFFNGNQTSAQTVIAIQRRWDEIE